jgi:hypothetical protein
MKLMELEVMTLVDVSGLPGSTTTYRLASTTQESMIFELRPGITPGHILQQVDLTLWGDCFLARTDDPETPLPESQDLFDLLSDCETVYAIPVRCIARSQ